MKVLIFISQFYLQGGSERLAVELAEELNNRGIHTDILNMYTEDLPGVAEKTKELLMNGIPNVFFLKCRVHPSPLNLIKAITKFNRLIRENCYDIVETSSLTPTLIAAWGLQKTNTRHIAGIHQVFLIERDNSIQQKILRWSLSLNQKIRYYSVSDNATKQWIRYSGSSPNFCRRVYNSVSEDFYKVKTEKIPLHNEFRLPENSKILLCVGRLAVYKRPDLLLEAISTFCDTENIAVLYVGRPDLTVEGTREMLNHMEQKIISQNLSHRIKFLGNSSNVPHIMASADLLVHPTQMEAFGLVLVEALASGLQVVATNVEGIPEVLRETDSIMVPPDNPNSLREAIMKTLNRSSVETAIAIEKGKIRAESFRTSVRTIHMIKLFEDVLSNQF